MEPKLAGRSDGASDWVPMAARSYLRHVTGGLSIRALAREEGVHPSTILRQVRRIEERRDDPLVDAAITALGARFAEGGGDPAAGRQGDTAGAEGPAAGPKSARKEHGGPGYAVPRGPGQSEAAELLEQEALRILRLLAEPGALLALADEMEKAVVMREHDGAATRRSGVTERAVAEAMVLRGWLEPGAPIGKVRRYRISAAGRSSLRRPEADLRAAPGAAGPGTTGPGTTGPGDAGRETAGRDVTGRGSSRGGPQAGGFCEAAASFAGRGPAEGTARASRGAGLRDAAMGWAGVRTSGLRERTEPGRYGTPESPVLTLGRRRDRGGVPFLAPALIRAADRLREDFELARLGAGGPLDLERLLSAEAGEPPPERGAKPDCTGSDPAGAVSRAAARDGRRSSGSGPGHPPRTGASARPGTRDNASAGGSAGIRTRSEDGAGQPQGLPANSQASPEAEPGADAPPAVDPKGRAAASRSPGHDRPTAARLRLAAAVTELGPGLADVALRCCCLLEGLESAERRLGWSSRSGKIVLRIALERLCRHYETEGARHGVMIG